MHQRPNKIKRTKENPRFLACIKEKNAKRRRRVFAIGRAPRNPEPAAVALQVWDRMGNKEWVEMWVQNKRVTVILNTTVEEEAPPADVTLSKLRSKESGMRGITGQPPPNSRKCPLGGVSQRSERKGRGGGNGRFHHVACGIPSPARHWAVTATRCRPLSTVIAAQNGTGSGFGLLFWDLFSYGHINCRLWSSTATGSHLSPANPVREICWLWY